MTQHMEHKPGETSVTHQHLIVVTDDWKLLAWQRMTDRWTVLTEVPEDSRNNYSTICGAPGVVIITGGLKSKVCMMYEIRKDEWRRLADMPEDLLGHGALLLGDELIIIGGWWEVTHKRSNHVYSLNLSTNTYKKLHDRIDRVNCIDKSIASINNKIYVCGGYPNLSKFEEYDAVDDNWIVKAELPQASNVPQGGTVNHNNKIYMIEKDYYMIYTPIDDNWRTVTYPTISKYITQAAVIDNKIVLLAGPTEEDMSLHSFNEELVTWERFSHASMNVKLKWRGNMVFA